MCIYMYVYICMLALYVFIYLIETTIMQSCIVCKLSFMHTHTRAIYNSIIAIARVLAIDTITLNYLLALYSNMQLDT